MDVHCISRFILNDIFVKYLILYYLYSLHEPYLYDIIGNNFKMVKGIPVFIYAFWTSKPIIFVTLEITFDVILHLNDRKIIILYCHSHRILVYWYPDILSHLHRNIL